MSSLKSLPRGTVRCLCAAGVLFVVVLVYMAVSCAPAPTTTATATPNLAATIQAAVEATLEPTATPTAGPYTTMRRVTQNYLDAFEEARGEDNTIDQDDCLRLLELHPGVLEAIRQYRNIAADDETNGLAHADRMERGIAQFDRSCKSMLGITGEWPPPTPQS